MVVLAAVAVLLIVALLGPITDLIARHDVSALSQAQRATHLQAARETARTQLLTLSAGIFAAAALLFTALNFTLARQGQVTTRYTDAISQLGSDKLDWTPTGFVDTIRSGTMVYEERTGSGTGSQEVHPGI